jgi:TonB family protein
MYNAGVYLSAQEHFELALKLKPSDRTIPLWIARSIHRQYQPGVNKPENWAIGMQAVAAYERALAANPGEALRSSLELLTDMGDNELADRWRLRIANAFNVDPKERSEAFTAMAARMLECAHTIDVAVPPEKEKALAHFGGVQLCISSGLEYVEKALKLDPNNATALQHQTGLQLEKQKIEKLVAEHDPTVRVPSGEWRRGDGESVTRNATPLNDCVVDLRQIAFEKGVPITGMAICKPAPLYPPEVKAAGISGVVTVAVSVDEFGKVFYAVPVTGHYLLRPAAVNAAKRAEFKPQEDLGGQLTKASYTLSYYFLLKEGQ